MKPLIHSSSFRSSIARAAGFTLVELAIVLAVISVLAGSALPSMRGLVRSMRITSATNDMMASLALTRGEAVKRGGHAVMCKSADGATCSSTGGWEQGWIVFRDANDNATREPGEDVVQRVQAIGPDVKLTGNQTVAKYVSYVPTGVTKLAGGGFQAGTFSVCSPSGGAGREIILSSSGRPRVQKIAAPACL